jgi:hypothetical protein
MRMLLILISAFLLLKSNKFGETNVVVITKDIHIYGIRELRSGDESLRRSF